MERTLKIYDLQKDSTIAPLTEVLDWSFWVTYSWVKGAGTLSENELEMWLKAENPDIWL